MLRLAERLSPGMSTVTRKFARWLDKGPIRPARFVPKVEACMRERRYLKEVR